MNFRHNQDIKRGIMDQSNVLPSPIGIAGLGLIGGSLGLDLQSLGITVHGLVHRSGTVKKAKERGLAQIVSTDPNVLKECEVIFLALPLEELINPSRALIDSLSKEAVITDVGSVKAPILKIWSELHPRFIGSHPMAGTAFSGVNSGKSGLFQDRPWVLTPNSNTDINALDIIKKIAVYLGSKVIITDAKKHDQSVALISHLPVLISAALLRTLGEQRDPNLSELCQNLASSGFEDTTRVGGGNPDLGTSMASHNTSAILNALSSYRWNLEQIEGAVLSGNWAQLHKELKYTSIIRKDYVEDNY